ncbi:MAG: carbohydrate-binding domain-containing protein, partial [Propionibacteriaceae bacterium]|nr:carbohydrate-binding domain-containing protein [Propionibacteriaceae bacterium]
MVFVAPSAHADTIGGLTITGGVQGTDYAVQSGSVILVSTPTALTISGTDPTYTIQTAAGITANLTLSAANITGGNGQAPIDVLGDAVVTLAAGTSNSLTTVRSAQPAIAITAGADLTITGAGSLTAASVVTDTCSVPNEKWSHTDWGLTIVAPPDSSYYA